MNMPGARHAEADGDTFSLLEIAERRGSTGIADVVKSGLFSRTRADLPGRATTVRDEFPDVEGASCSFVRTSPGEARAVRFVVDGVRKLSSCAAGGWLIEAGDGEGSVYWIPRLPVLRSFDAHGRILKEEDAALIDFRSMRTEASMTVYVPGDLHLDFVFWRLTGVARDVCTDLQECLNVERQRAYFWSSQTVYRSPADVYSFVINGHVYQNALAWPAKWKFCSELDAYELYLTLSGLELATGKRMYGLLRRQIVLSVIARQAQDGAWYHGEWTDLMEWHARFHAGALLLLECALEEWGDGVVRESLAKGASFAAAQTDNTDLGLWFLHDSLEESTESMDAMIRQRQKLTGTGAWKPTRFLGKSPTNKLILNTHIDTTVALDRYGAITGDHSFDGPVASALGTTLALLDLRPAECLYRVVYWAIGLTLLPEVEARRLPLALRALKRVVGRYLLPHEYRLRHAFPRIVMPGGFTERHLAPPHFDPKYHAVNVLDLARLWRRFRKPEIERALNAATGFVTSTRILDYWAEAGPSRFAIVVWAEALYHLCMLGDAPNYRHHLAEAMLRIEDAGLGFPPSLLGTNPEAVERTLCVACPSPTQAGLRVANLSRGARKEIIVVNPTTSPLELAWERHCGYELVWSVATDPLMPVTASTLHVPARGWLWGR